MVLFAEMVLFPDGIIAWVVVGLVAGFLAGLMLQQGQLGFIGDATAGVIGAVAGGVTTFLLVQEGTVRFLAAIAAAAVSAFLLIGILRKVMSASE